MKEQDTEAEVEVEDGKVESCQPDWMRSAEYARKWTRS